MTDLAIAPILTVSMARSPVDTVLPATYIPTTMDPKRFLVIRTGALGDFILTLPVLRTLRSAYPLARIDLAGRPEIVSLASDLAAGIFDIADAGWAPFFARDSRLPTRLADHLASTDLVLCYLPDTDGMLTGNLCRAGAGQVLTVAPHPPGDGSVHIVDHLLAPLPELGIPVPPDPAPRVVTTQRDRLRADEIAAGVGLLVDRALVIHPGSGGRTKRWRPHGFAAVADHIARSADRPIVLLDGPAEPGLASTVASLMSTPSVLLPPVPLGDLASLLERASLYIGNDSGPSHLAAAVGTPSVVLFGPTDPRIWAPRGPDVRIVCGDPGLPSERRLGTIQEAEVIGAVESLL